PQGAHPEPHVASFLVGGGLLAQSLFLRANLGREVFAEILRLENLSQLDFSSAVERSALQPFDRFFLRLHLPEPESSDQLFRFGEWSVSHRALISLELDAHALRARLKSFTREHHASVYELLIELRHLREDLFV